MPQSWDLLTQQQNRTLVAILLSPPLMVSIDWALAFDKLERPADHTIMRLSGLPFGEARTQAAYQCLHGGFQWLFFIDADVISPPNGLTRLLSHRLPIVSGLYHQRFPTWTGEELKYLPCIFNEGRDAAGNLVRTEVRDFQYGQIVEVHYVPGGCLLIHRSVFERMLAAGIKRFFEWSLHADAPASAGRSEDFEFCARARSIGIKVMADTMVQCIHEVPAKVDLKGLSAKT